MKWIGDILMNQNSLETLNSEQKVEKLNILTQLRTSTNISLWSSLLTINGFLFTLMIVILSLNAASADWWKLLIPIPFFILLFMSCSTIYNLFIRQRDIFLLYEKSIVPEYYPETVKDPNIPVIELLDKIKDLPQIEKRAIRLIIFNTIFICLYFLFLNLKVF